MKTFEINKYNKKIKITQNNKKIEISGPLGNTCFYLKKNIKFKNNSFFIENTSLSFFFNKVKDLFKSVSNGWFLELTLNGIGYKSFKIQDKIALDLGYSNLILYKPTPDVKIKNLKNKIVIFSINKEQLNNVTTSLKNYSIPDNYKGKGLVLKNEFIKLKKKAKS